MNWLELTPVAAVGGARNEDPTGDTVLQELDRYLRHNVVDYLQNRRGEPSLLEQALRDALRWLRVGDLKGPWEARWTQLLDLLQLGAELPNLSIPPLGRAGEVLRALVATKAPLQPSTLAARLGMSQQQLNNLVAGLEKNKLLDRWHVPGQKAAWLMPTAAGHQTAARFQEAAAAAAPQAAPSAAEIVLWPRLAATG